MSLNENYRSRLKANITSESLWIRILYMMLFYVIGHFVIAVVMLIALVQVVLSLVMGDPNKNLQTFSQGINHYLNHIVGFLTFNREAKPFPFSDWPNELDKR